MGANRVTSRSAAGRQHASVPPAPGVVSVGIVLVVLLAALAGGCKKGPDGQAKKIPRDENAAPVVMVDTAPGPAEVAFVDEVEPNGKPGEAMGLAPGSGVRGSLDGETDVDLYRVSVAEPGALAAEVSGIEGVDLVLELQDSQGQVLASSDRGPAMMVEGIPNMHVDKGEYLVAVREFVKKRRGKAGREPRVGPSPVYELVLRAPGPAERGHEVEPNDSMEQAAEVLIGDEVFGYMGWNQDVDIWKLSIEGFSAAYSLDLDIDGVPEVTFSLAILDPAGKTVVKRTGDKGGGISLRNLVVAEAAAGDEAPDSAAEPRFYYARLSARRSNPVEKYRLRMSSRLLEPEDEIEPNDEPAGAVVLREPDGPAEGVRRGYLTPGDVDHYQVSAGAEPMVLSVTTKPAAAVDVVLSVLVDGALAGEANAAKGGGEETLPDLHVPAGKTALVVIRGKGAPASDGAYELSWLMEPAAGVPLPKDDGDTGDLLDDEYGE